MDKTNLHLLLADDDLDDRDFFTYALEEISFPVILNTVNNGMELMDYLLSELAQFPDVIFLDLNMPLKSGLECIEEIKSNDKLRHIPIVIYSTSRNRDVVNQLYEIGAHFYIQKPSTFAKLKAVINTAVTLFKNENLEYPTKDNFIIEP
ncbi:response regulator [Arenibacter certesii]|uniref:Response regulatory domain-containing protein n=1 Tax=Arenibacter certesii TaxID=228955 RepID=A0A918J7M8_9FLAO|nr:response regulator [Arenibacter certesii]GGW50810.1 hypothetical protein GCM10007383_38150 [Arenibacter certesii]